MYYGDIVVLYKRYGVVLIYLQQSPLENIENVISRDRYGEGLLKTLYTRLKNKTVGLTDHKANVSIEV